MNLPKSGHGGSLESGLVLPAGMGDLVRGDGSLFEPPEVTAAKKMAAERQGRAMQLERRRIGSEVLARMIKPPSYMPAEGDNLTEWREIVERDSKWLAEVALSRADALINKTGGGI